MNRQEKEKLVIELYKQGKTIREIAQIVHMSFGDISFIIRRETGEAEEQERIRRSKSSQALKMFEEGNTAVQVAIKLDIETQDVERLYKEYWKLKGLYKLNEIYAELKDNIVSFVELYHLTKKEGMTQQQVIDALKIAEEIPNLQAERQYIEDCIDDDGPKILELNKRKVTLDSELRFILGEVESAREYRNNQLKSIQDELDLAKDHAINELKLVQEKSDKQKAWLANEVATAQEHTINELNNSKEYLLALRDADNKLKFIQKEVDKLKKEEQQLTSSIQRLNAEELEILSPEEQQRRRKHQDQDIQDLQSKSQPQLKQQSVIIALAHELQTRAT